MAIDLSQLATDLGYIITDLPTTFIISGVSYTGVFEPLQVDRLASDGGYIDMPEGVLRAKQSSFSTLPIAGITLSIASMVYRVDSVKKSPDAAEINMVLISPDK